MFGFLFKKIDKYRMKGKAINIPLTPKEKHTEYNKIKFIMIKDKNNTVSYIL